MRFSYTTILTDCLVSCQIIYPQNNTHYLSIVYYFFLKNNPILRLKLLKVNLKKTPGIGALA